MSKTKKELADSVLQRAQKKWQYIKEQHAIFARAADELAQKCAGMTAAEFVRYWDETIVPTGNWFIAGRISTVKLGTKLEQAGRMIQVMQADSGDASFTPSYSDALATALVEIVRSMSEAEQTGFVDQHLDFLKKSPGLWTKLASVLLGKVANRYAGQMQKAFEQFGSTLTGWIGKLTNK